MDQKKINATILIKRRVVGRPGPPTSLAPGELAFNEVDDTAYIRTTSISPTGSNLSDPGFF